MDKWAEVGPTALGAGKGSFWASLIGLPGEREGLQLQEAGANARG